MNLRPYQEQLITDVRAKFAQGNKRIIMQAPTGAGKTVTFVELVKRTLLKSPQSAVAIFTHRTELLSQAERTLKRAGIATYTLTAGQKMHKFEAGCTVCMVETFNRREINTDLLKLAIIDEAHFSNFNKIIPQLGDVHIIGATATPISANKDVPIKDIYEDIVVGIEIEQLIEEGFLSAPKYYHLVPKNIDKLRVKGGEFSDESQKDVFEDVDLYADLIKEFAKFATKKTIVFCNNQSTTIQVCKEFQRAGYEADYVISGEDGRETAFSNFANGTIQILVNCGIATTGFDDPSIECVLIYRATKSLPLYLQMVGRGGRVTETKKEFTVLDFGGNILRHGFWHDSIDWADKFHNPKKKNEGVAPVKECPKCGALVRASAKECKECGLVFDKKPKQAKEGELIRVDDKKYSGKRILDLTIEEFLEVAEMKQYKHGFVVRWLRVKGMEAMMYYAEKKGYQKGWVFKNLIGDTSISNYILK